jgi:hypothetical protein
VLVVLAAQQQCKEASDQTQQSPLFPSLHWVEVTEDEALARDNLLGMAVAAAEQVDIPDKQLD